MVTPERIALARRRRGVTVAELARELQLSAQSVTNYEHDRQRPSATTLAALATTLDFPETFFHQPCPDVISEDAASFRARSRLSLRRRTAALGSGTLALDVNAWLERTFHLPGVDVPTLEYPDAETAAGMTRARWELGNAATPNMIHLLESRGVRVFSLPQEHHDVDAFSFWHDGTPYILLNTSKSPERTRFDAAHELGHLVMHGGARETPSPVTEQEANTFASAFLMPAVSIRGHIPHAPRLDQVVRAKRSWGVSALALTYRLHALDMLKDWQYRTICVELSRHGYRSAEHNGIAPESSQLLGKVFADLREHGESLSDVASELHLSAEELTSLVFGLVLTPVANNATPSRSSAASSHREGKLTLV